MIKGLGTDIIGVQRVEKKIISDTGFKDQATPEAFDNVEKIVDLVLQFVD